MAKKSLYQTLQVSPTAEPEVIKAAYEARIAALKESAAPEVAAERTILREAYELLGDPVRRKLYDARLKEELLRALSSGGEEVRPRPANAAASRAAEPGSPIGLMAGIALILAVGIGGTWVWLDHKRKVEAQRLEAERLAEEARRKQDEALLRRETVDWVKDRSDSSRETAEQRRQESMRQSDSRRADYDRQRAAAQEQAVERQRAYDRQRAEAEARRREQENQRQAQQALERDKRYLKELERNRPISIR